MFNWENGDPVSFQPWKKNKLPQKYNIKFPHQCKQFTRKGARFSSGDYIERILKFCPWDKTGYYNYTMNRYKYSDEKYMQPKIEKRCTFMLLTNLAEPEWESIDCSQRIIGDIMCVIPRKVTIATNISFATNVTVFKNPCVFINEKCYSFSWGFLNDRSVSRNIKMKISKSTHVAMEYLVTAPDAEFPPFHLFLNVIRYCNISRKWILLNNKEQHKGLHIVMTHGSKYIRYGNVFECGDGIFVSYAYVCDGKKDCPGNIPFDETECICESSQVLSNKCKYIITKEGIKRCSPYLLTMKDGTCLYYGLIKVNSKPMAHNHEFTCMGNNAINLMVNNNLITKCLPSRNDEKQMLLKYNSNSICQENGQLACKEDHKECYSKQKYVFTD